MSVTVAIHQPNFFPWLGFFRKWAQADIFVLLDDVQITNAKGSWTNRTAIADQSGAKKWLTVPISREGSALQKILDVSIVRDSSWKRKVIETFRHSYSKSTSLDEAISLLKENLERDNSSLVDLNRHGLELVGTELGLDLSRLVWSSSLNVSSEGTARLVDIFNLVGGDRYLAGPYPNALLAFEQSGVELELLNFRHLIYKQRNSHVFTQGLSVLDAIANVGTDKTRQMLLDGIDS